MWVKQRSNRIISEREQIKEHLMHMQRLRNVKPQVDMRKPPKPNHVQNNYKKELQKRERLQEIQYQNRVLLRKMLQIDLKPSLNVGGSKKQLKRPASATGQRLMRPQSGKSIRTDGKEYRDQPKGLNSYTSLNRANRIRSLARIIDENKVLLSKLQNTRSNYDNGKWETDYVKNMNRKNMISKNSDRYCRNPYFLNSICTNNAGLQNVAVSTNRSLRRVGPQASSSKAFSTYYADGDKRTISDFEKRKMSKRMLTSKASDSNFANDHYGQLAPPKLGGKRRGRPFSAPRHQGLRSQGLKAKAQGNLPQLQNNQNMAMMPMQGYPAEMQGQYMMPQQNQAQMMSQQQYMATVNEQNTNQQYFQNQMVEEQPEDMDEQQYGEEEEEEQYDGQDMEQYDGQDMEQYEGQQMEMDGMDGMDDMEDGEEDEELDDEEAALVDAQQQQQIMEMNAQQHAQQQM